MSKHLLRQLVLGRSAPRAPSAVCGPRAKKTAIALSIFFDETETIWYINIVEREVIISIHPQEVIPGDFMYIDQQLSRLKAVGVE